MPSHATCWRGSGNAGGIVGCGLIGQLYARLLTGLGCKVAAAADPVLQRARDLAPARHRGALGPIAAQRHHPQAFPLRHQPIEDIDAEQFTAVLKLIGSDEILVFASDYPHWDADEPASGLPRELQQNIHAGECARLLWAQGTRPCPIASTRVQPKR